MTVANIAKPLAVVAFLAGCATEAGIGPENASFGIAYGNNTLIQSAEYQRGAFIGEVSADFAANVDDTINFAFNRSTLDASSRRALDSQAAWLRENPTVRVRITGHTDLVGGEGYN
ncbi:MAG: OmpA family protein, partial [Pseudomonadota bacterium]